MVLVFGSLISVASAEAAYYAEGTLVSYNMLSGATGVTAISGVTITATLPANTTAQIKYSQNNVNFYNASGTEEGWDTITAGTNTISVSGLGWNTSIFYYKLRLTTTDSVATPIISDVQVNYTGGATPAPTATRYQYQGTLLSDNVLAGAGNVTAINSVTVTATLPGGATVGIKYSQDNINFYNASGVAEAYDTVAEGGNPIDISALGWTGEIFYYKLQWTTIDNWTSPVVSDVTVDYTGDVVQPPNCPSGCQSVGSLVSTDLMIDVGRAMLGTEYFAYAIPTLPGGSSVTVQFSQDGTTWYDVNGTLDGATTLLAGDHTEYATALSLTPLGWRDGTSFYYKLNLATTDNAYTPVITFAGLLFPQMTYISTSQNDVMTSGLVGLWSFDGGDVSGTTAYDRSGSGNNGTLVNGPTVTRGQLGQALSFDGSDDYVTVSDNAVLDATDTADLTLTGWFNRDTFTTDDTIIAKRNGVSSGDTGYILYIDDATDQLILEVSDGTDEYSLTSTGTFTTVGWNHYAVVWDQDSATNSEIYINGIANNATDAGTIGNIGDLSNALAFRVGAESDNGNPFAGKVDEVRVYNRALSATEIQSLYTLGQSDKVNSAVSQPQGTGRLDSGLAGYWKLDDGSGSTAVDSSTNGNNGTLTNGPTWTTGQIGSAVDFDGYDDYVEVGSGIKVSNADRGAISAWINGDVFASFTRTIFCFGGAAAASAARLTLFINTSGNLVISQINTNGGGADSIVGSTTLSTGTWHHVMLVSDGTAYTMYVNGKKESLTVSSGSNSGDWMADTSPTAPVKSVIGESYSNGTHSLFFNGRLDDVRIYDRPLSPDEVAQLYRLTTPTGVDTSLKGYWSFNGADLSGTTAYDRSGAGNNGTLTNGPTVTRGQLGQALNFDGSNDYVNIADNAAFDVNTTVTYSAWIKLASLPGTSGFVIRKWSSSSEDKSIKVVSTGKAQFYLYNIFGGTNLDTQQTFSVGRWYFVAGTYDGTTAKIYVNGLLDNSKSASGNVADGVGPLYIGASPDGGSTYFPGLIDEVRVYNRALSADEIKSLYNAPR